MEQNIFYLLSISVGLLILQHAVLGILFFKQKKLEKDIMSLQKIIDDDIADNSKDLVEVMSKFMAYLEKEFDVNFTNQKKLQEWLEKNLETLTNNTVKTNASIEQTQRFLGRMSESLGIVQRSNLQDI